MKQLKESRGRYIVLEGLDGSGKSTQHSLLLQHYGSAATGLREPGGTKMAESLRALVKDGELQRSPRTNAYLFSAARADLVDQRIRPTIEQGKHVIADRNWLSSIAYQAAEGAAVEEIASLAQLATQEFYHPDIVIFIDTDPEVCQQRLQLRGGGAEDYFDRKGLVYFERVRDGYLQYLSKLKNVVHIDGNGNPQEVGSAILRAVRNSIQTTPAA